MAFIEANTNVAYIIPVLLAQDPIYNTGTIWHMELCS